MSDPVSTVVILFAVAVPFIVVQVAGVAGFVVSGNPLWLILTAPLLLLED